jgi:DNA-binding GntR family transcriptional regulator
MEAEILRDIIRKKIIDLILAGKLKPGGRIKEVALSKLLKVSRTPLREALIALEKIGLISFEPNIGFTLKELSVQEAEELYPLIALLESHALCLSFSLVVTQARHLELINETFYRKRKSPKEASIADREFHHCLTQLCRNSILLQMIDELRLRISCYEHRYMEKVEQIEHSYEQHKDIIKAIKEENFDEAKKALLKNWEFGARFLVTELIKENCN